MWALRDFKRELKGRALLFHFAPACPSPTAVAAYFASFVALAALRFRCDGVTTNLHLFRLIYTNPSAQDQIASANRALCDGCQGSGPTFCQNASGHDRDTRRHFPHELR